jgi:hypothetical protein
MGAVPKGVSGGLGSLVGASGWVTIEETCLDNPDMAVGDDMNIPDIDAGGGDLAQVGVIAQGDIEVKVKEVDSTRLGGADS